MEDLGKEQGVYSTTPSRAISFSLHFSAENLGQQHHPSCWPLSGGFHGPSCLEDHDASQIPTFPSPKRCFPLNPRETEQARHE